MVWPPAEALLAQLQPQVLGVVTTRHPALPRMGVEGREQGATRRTRLQLGEALGAQELADRASTQAGQARDGAQAVAFACKALTTS